MRKRKSVKFRILNNIHITPDGHWIWLGTLHKSGHAKIKVSGKTIYVGRLVLQIFKNEDMSNPEDFSCHIRECTRRDCVNPDHLYKGNAKTNQEDSLAIGTNYYKNITYCPYGHEYTTINTYINPNTGKRLCRDCQKAHQWGITPKEYESLMSTSRKCD